MTFAFPLQHRGRMLTTANVFSGVLRSLAGVLYAVAIPLYDTQLAFLLAVLPWLMSAICCVTLDLLVSFIVWSVSILLTLLDSGVYTNLTLLSH